MVTTEDWMNFYNTGGIPAKPYFQFGANPEVEDVLRKQGNDGLRVFDDAEHPAAMARTEPWAEGFAFVRAHPQLFFRLVCGVCSTPSKRKAAVDRIEYELREASNWRWATVVSGSAYKAVNVKPAEGSLILDMCYVAPFVTISKHAALLPGSSVYHNSHIGAFVILVGGCRVLGRSVVEAGTRICCNAVVLPEGTVGKGSTVGALQSVKRLNQDDWMCQ